MTKKKQIEYWLLTYGNFIFECCTALIKDPKNTHWVFQIIFKNLSLKSKKIKQFPTERSWVIKILWDQLHNFLSQNHIHSLKKPTLNPQARLQHFDFYFQNLSPEDQMLLLLKQKYQIPFFEIAFALHLPESSLKFQYQQALKMLELWIWA